MSVRPEPTSPNIPRISPRRTSKLTSLTRGGTARSSTASTTSPGRERAPGPPRATGPAMRSITRSREASAMGNVPRTSPSFITVTRSAMRGSSSSRWLM